MPTERWVARSGGPSSRSLGCITFEVPAATETAPEKTPEACRVTRGQRAQRRWPHSLSDQRLVLPSVPRRFLGSVSESHSISSCFSLRLAPLHNSCLSPVHTISSHTRQTRSLFLAHGRTAWLGPAGSFAPLLPRPPQPPSHPLSSSLLQKPSFAVCCARPRAPEGIRESKTLRERGDSRKMGLTEATRSAGSWGPRTGRTDSPGKASLRRSFVHSNSQPLG